MDPHPIEEIKRVFGYEIVWNILFGIIIVVFFYDITYVR